MEKKVEEYNKNKENKENKYQEMNKIQKLARDAMKNQYRYLTQLNNNNNFPQSTEESNRLSEIEYPNLKTNSNINNANSVNFENEKKETNHKNRNDIVFPLISTNNSVKIEETINNIKDDIINDENNRLDEVNNMMKKVIEEN